MYNELNHDSDWIRLPKDTIVVRETEKRILLAWNGGESKYWCDKDFHFTHQYKRLAGLCHYVAPHLTLTTDLWDLL